MQSVEPLPISDSRVSKQRLAKIKRKEPTAAEKENLSSCAAPPAAASYAPAARLLRARRRRSPEPFRRRRSGSRAAAPATTSSCHRRSLAAASSRRRRFPEPLARGCARRRLLPPAPLAGAAPLVRRCAPDAAASHRSRLLPCSRRDEEEGELGSAHTATATASPPSKGQHVSADAKTVEHIYLVLIFVCIHGVRFISIFALHLHGIRMRSIERRKMVVDHGAASRNIQRLTTGHHIRRSAPNEALDLMSKHITQAMQRSSGLMIVNTMCRIY
ncbi:uncharacterized protein LOC127755721 [Oryza glaberrima]|uniref:uncharacterized protein LOC127755721 n=1 Tax=Oryza glaberrima TaxID=4538 RepID=UPI00224BF690|nr:uncharacterized protein LOC127755721 [Oryza glaberrima]